MHNYNAKARQLPVMIRIGNDPQNLSSYHVGVQISDKYILTLFEIKDILTIQQNGVYISFIGSTVYSATLYNNIIFDVFESGSPLCYALISSEGGIDFPIQSQYPDLNFTLPTKGDTGEVVVVLYSINDDGEDVVYSMVIFNIEYDRSSDLGPLTVAVTDAIDLMYTGFRWEFPQQALGATMLLDGKLVGLLYDSRYNESLNQGIFGGKPLKAVKNFITPAMCPIDTTQIVILLTKLIATETIYIMGSASPELEVSVCIKGNSAKAEIVKVNPENGSWEMNYSYTPTSTTLHKATIVATQLTSYGVECGVATKDILIYVS